MTLVATATLPKIEEQKLSNPEVQKTIDDVVREISQRKTEAETAQSIRAINPADVEEAILVAEQNADRFDKACEPIVATIQEFRGIFRDLLARVKSSPSFFSDKEWKEIMISTEEMQKSFKSLELDWNARRYRQESNYNRKAAELYEIRVRRSSVESDIHRERSKMFFYCMLIAQVAVMISSLALGRSQRILFLLAVFFGLASLGFGGYVSLLL